MDAMRDKLKEFYQKQFSEMLSVRKTASNMLLIERSEGKKTILAKFSLAMGEVYATMLASAAKDGLACAKADVEMAKIECPKPTLATLSLGTLPTDANGMEMPLKDFREKVVDPINDLFSMGRTGSVEKPLE